MNYSIWVKPYMPSEEEVEQGIMYVPQSHIRDTRLIYLDRQIYLYLCVKEQLDKKKYQSIEEIIEDIKTNPDDDEMALDDYLERTGKSIDDMTVADWESLPVSILTYEDVEKSLNRLNKFGYIKML